MDGEADIGARGDPDRRQRGVHLVVVLDEEQSRPDPLPLIDRASRMRLPSLPGRYAPPRKATTRIRLLPDRDAQFCWASHTSTTGGSDLRRHGLSQRLRPHHQRRSRRPEEAHGSHSGDRRGSGHCLVGASWMASMYGRRDLPTKEAEPARMSHAQGPHEPCSRPVGRPDARLLPPGHARPSAHGRRRRPARRDEGSPGHLKRRGPRTRRGGDQDVRRSGRRRRRWTPGPNAGCRPETDNSVKEHSDLLHNLVTHNTKTGDRGLWRQCNHTPPFHPENCHGMRTCR